MTAPSHPRRLLAPYRYCTGAGCHARTRDGRCSACRTRAEQQRGTATARGYASPRWRAFRTWWLAEHPLCGTRADGQRHPEHSECAAARRPVFGNHVDHIVPVTGPDDPRWFDPLAVQTLCVTDHSRKTQREQGQGGRKGYAGR